MRTLPSLAVVWLAIAPSAVLADTPAVRVDLRAQVRLPGPYFTVGDVAEVSGRDHELRDSIASLRIGVVPPIGYPMSVPAAKLRATLRHHGVAGSSRLVWGGAKSVVVRCLARRVHGEGATKGARRILTTYLANQVPGASSIQVTPTRQLRAIDLPAGDVTVTPRLGNSRGLSRRMVVWVDFSVNGRRYQTVPVWFDVKVMKRVLVSSVDVPAKHQLAPSDFHIAERDIAGLSGTPLDSNADLAVLSSRGVISADSVLLTQAVEQSPLVRPRQTVAVRVSVGGVQITTHAVAQAEGRAGDLIRVRNPHSHQTYIAQVTGPGAVSVSSH